jgi:hypothetical protein
METIIESGLWRAVSSEEWREKSSITQTEVKLNFPPKGNGTDCLLLMQERQQWHVCNFPKDSFENGKKSE